MSNPILKVLNQLIFAPVSSKPSSEKSKKETGAYKRPSVALFTMVEISNFRLLRTLRQKLRKRTVDRLGVSLQLAMALSKILDRTFMWYA